MSSFRKSQSSEKEILIGIAAFEHFSLNLDDFFSVFDSNSLIKWLYMMNCPLRQAPTKLTALSCDSSCFYLFIYFISEHSSL